MRPSRGLAFVSAAILAGCAPDRAAECKAFVDAARAGQSAAKASEAPSGQSTLEQRAERYRAYARALEQLEIREPELKRLVGDYTTHVRGSADLFEQLKGTPLPEAVEQANQRDEAGRKLTALIHAHCATAAR